MKKLLCVYKCICNILIIKGRIGSIILQSSIVNLKSISFLNHQLHICIEYLPWLESVALYKKVKDTIVPHYLIQFSSTECERVLGRMVDKTDKIPNILIVIFIINLTNTYLCMCFILL